MVAAVDFAREHGLPVGVQATGHNFGHAFVGGMRINTRLMQGVAIDPAARWSKPRTSTVWRG